MGQSILTFIILLIPFGLFWFLLFRRFKKNITTSLNYCVLILLTLLALDGYFILAAQLSLIKINDTVSVLVWGVSYLTFMILFWPTIAVLILTTIFVIRKKVNKKAVDA